MREVERFSEQLQQVGRWTKARWAAWVTPIEDGWEVLLDWGLTRRRGELLTSYLRQQKWKVWVSGALAHGRERRRKVGVAHVALLGERIYAFPVPAQGGVLLVGGNGLNDTARRMWRIVALGAPALDAVLARDVDAFGCEASSVCARLMERLGKSDYRPQKVAEIVIASVTELVACESAYLAVRDGKTWRVLFAWGENAEALQGKVTTIDAMPLLRPLLDGQVVVLPQEPWPGVPAPRPWYWMGVPLMRGKQVIGMLTAGRGKSPFRSPESDRLKHLLERVGWVLENVFSLEEIGEHLRHKAVINDVFLSVFSSDNVVEAAHNATRYLRRVLKADVAGVLVPDGEGNLQVLGSSPEDFQQRRFPVAESLCGYVLETGNLIRLGNVKQAPQYFPLTEEMKSELCVPMRSKQGIIGVINLESVRPDAFDEEDERLLQGVAGQLALLLETMRLRQDVAARAQRMALVHRVVSDVVGLLDEQQIVTLAAQRISDYFGFEVTVVVVFEDAPEGRRVLFRAVAGSGSGAQELASLPNAECPLEGDGVVGYVLRTGKSALVNDTEADDRYVPFHGIVALSELCVPLFSHDDENRVIGVIDIARGVKNAFTDDDRLALEAVGGLLSAVLANARRYRRLKATVRHLDAARDTALDIIADLEIETLLQRIVSRVRRLLDAKGAEIGLLDVETGVVRIAATENPWRDYTGYTFPVGKGVSGWVAAHGQTQVIDDYSTWEGRSPSRSPAAFRSIASVPLTFHDEVVGVLTVYDDREGRRFNEDEVALLELLAPQIAIAVRNALLYQELGERIEAQREAEHRLVRSARLAAVGEMAAAVAHELNSPLTTVMGFVELVLEEIPPHSKIYEDLKLVLQEARRARDIVRRLLDFARRTEPVRIATNVNTLVQETLALVSHLVKTSGVTLEVDLDDHLPLVQVDRAEIKQVLLNLIHNALQAMPHGGRLRITTSRIEDDSGTWVAMEVEDTGVGMSPEQQMRIFEPFYTTRRGGTGMGLAVSYGIVQKHGGTIFVQSKEGEGSTFSVRLPVS